MAYFKKTMDGVVLRIYSPKKISVAAGNDAEEYRIPVAVHASMHTGMLKRSLFRALHISLAFALSIGILAWQVVVPLRAFEAHVVNVTARIENRVCTAADFETDALGNAIIAGQKIGAEYTPWGLSISAKNHVLSHPDVALAFDSAHPTGGDEDLGTPHEDFGGPGIGEGGKAGAPGENAAPFGNVLIIAENERDPDADGIIDVPDDEAFGGVLEFSFAKPAWVASVVLIDIEEQGGEIVLLDGSSAALDTLPIPAVGDNSVQTITLNKAGVAKMEVRFAGSGAVDNVCFEKIENADVGTTAGVEQQKPEESFSEPAPPEEVIALNEFLPNPGGEEYGFNFGEDSGDMPQGEWVELYNNGANAYDLAGWYVWDASGSEANKIFVTPANTNPATTTIAAHAWLVVYFNKAVLNNTGDSVRLFNTNNELVDEYTYTASGNACALEPTPGGGNASSTPAGSCSVVPANKSFARIPDGAGAWVDPVPTPGAANTDASGAADDEQRALAPAEEPQAAEEPARHADEPEEPAGIDTELVEASITHASVSTTTIEKEPAEEEKEEKADAPEHNNTSTATSTEEEIAGDYADSSEPLADAAPAEKESKNIKPEEPVALEVSVSGEEPVPEDPPTNADADIKTEEAVLDAALPEEDTQPSSESTETIAEQEKTALVDAESAEVPAEESAGSEEQT